MLELRTDCLPITRLTTRSNPGNKDSVVDETHLLVRTIMLEGVSPIVAIRHHKLDDVLVSVGDLDRVRLNMDDLVTLLLNRVLQINHEQCTALSDDVVNVSIVLEGIRELGRGQTIDDVDHNLQSVRECLSIFFALQIWLQSAIKHLTCGLVVLMLNRNTSLLQRREVLRVDSEEVEFFDRRRMHRCNVELNNILVVTRLSIDVTTFTDLLSSVSALTVTKLTTLEVFRELRIFELVLGTLIALKDDSCGVFLCRVIDRETTELRQDLTCNEVLITIHEGRLSRNNIVVTILCDFFPLLFRNRLVPGKTELLVMNSELHLELFQTLLLRAKVINIRKGKVVRSTETGVGLVSDDVLRELIQLLIAVAHDAPIENMVIIATTVKPDKELLGEFLNLVRLRVDHT